jgi:hypothetical protein
MSEEQEDLDLGQQFLNVWSGADFLLHWVLAIPWILQMWLYQWQKAKRNGEWWFPQLPKSILVDDTDCRAQDILSAYRIHNMHLGNSFENGGQMEHAILLPASQYDYADAVLTQNGVPVLSEAGTKRGYTMRQPRDYSERRPAQRAPKQHGAKLGSSQLGKPYR